jgi:putative salt-induced outer membrane protein YdiY
MVPEGARPMQLPTRRILAAFWWLLCALPILSYPACAQGTDVVVMKNGDRITGKVRKLDHGQLYIETPYAVNQIPVDWLQVERVESTRQFQMEMSDGKRIVGTIEKTPTADNPDKDFQIRGRDTETDLRAADVVGIRSQKDNIWRQMRGSVDFGYSYASGSADTAINVDATDTYTTTKYQIAGSLDSTFSGQANSKSTNRQDLSTTSLLFLSRHAFVGGVTDFLTSNQQSLDLRQTYGGGYGRYFIRTNNTQFAWLGGLVYIREKYSPDAGPIPKDQNVEAFVEFNYDWFRFNASELNTTLQIYPGISDAGRVRTNLNTSYSLTIKRDWNLTLNFWDTFDSTPPPEARKNEFGISTGFGLKF